MQSVGLLLERELHVRTEQPNRCNFLAAHCGAPERTDNCLAGRRPTEFNREERLASGSEAKIFRRVARGVGIVERTSCNLRWAFAVNLPGTRAVNGLAVYFQPRTNFAQDLLDFLGYRAIRPRADVQEQIAVLADDIDELVNDELRRLERVVLDVAPRLLAH